jgi:hypothetical protein
MCPYWALALKGGFAIAVRASMSNVSAGGFGAAALDKVSRQTVTRHEVFCAAALVAASREFYRFMKMRMYFEHPGRGILM